MRDEEGERDGGGGPFRFRPTRLRFPAQHPFFEDGDVQRHLRLQDAQPSDPPGGASRPHASFSCPAVGCAQVFDSLASCEHHYGLLHRSACSACQRTFPSAHLLHLHLLEWHDALFGLMAEKHSLYQCLVESCPEKFKNSKERKEHLVRAHCYPSDFRFDKPVKAKSTKEVRSPSRESAFPMDVREGEDCREPAADDGMEVGPSESTEEKPPQPGAEDTPAFPLPERTLYRTSVPPTVCFGQGAKRSFQGRKKKA
ncbi:zinc finger protein 511 [Lacerta agilis]|uniref:zinc finger protein 511 n=1 Tax=Lacerta agilis TaxID=80427 RepID=UPI001419B2CE|nr:zinc finger protein 511 [Lacerta agilis]